MVPVPATNAKGGVAEDEEMVSLYASSQKIYPRSVSGLFSNWRWLTVWITQIVFYGLPWLEWNARQAVLFDLEARRFYIFGLVLYPQDFIYLTGLLVISALALFLFTAVAGRLWCGYACPQTVYTEVFLWIEKKVEGDRSARMRLDKADLSAQKLGKKWLKHALWILFSIWTGFTFVGYFTPIRELAAVSLAASLGPWQAFWIFFYGFATYGNAGFMREQVCKYMCPYARFQSAMFDKDTLIVSYDIKRGEPRGPASKTAARGDCIDCTMCVQVCPTGIDIREGLQYECIGCAACVDACNGVMDKVGLPHGLIRYTSERGLQHGLSARGIARRLLRPRVLAYSVLLATIVTAFSVSLAMRTPLKLDVIRDRGSMGREVGDGLIENVYRLQVMNTSEQAHSFRVSVTGLAGIADAAPQEFKVAGASTRAVPVRFQVPRGQLSKGSHPISIEVAATDTPALRVVEDAVFIIPK